jgi:hypothetical protein
MELVRADEMLPEVEAIECSIADGAVSEGLEGEVRDALKDFKLKSDQWRPLEELQTLTLRISNHIDQRNSEQKEVYNCLHTLERNTRETINTVRVIAFIVATVAGFWSAVAWWIWRDEIRSLFYVAANLLSSSFSELLASMH